MNKSEKKNGYRKLARYIDPHGVSLGEQGGRGRVLVRTVVSGSRGVIDCRNLIYVSSSIS